MLHVLPIQDEKPHIHSTDCPCNPKVEWNDPHSGEAYSTGLVVHDAWDGRKVELAIGESGWVGGWELVTA